MPSANFFALLGKVLEPVQSGKISAKNPGILKIQVVKSSDWEISVFYLLLTNTLKLITSMVCMMSILYLIMFKP